MKDKMLIVEDDKSVLTGLVDLLSDEGFTVVTAETGTEALKKFKLETPDIILLDIMIPEKSGYDVCKEIRKENATVPIIMLTAKGEEIDTVVGLEIGADDYIIKPFKIKELVARVRAVLRRSRKQETKRVSLIEFGDVVVDPKTFTGKKGKKEFKIKKKELELLQLFIEHDGEVISRDTILNKVWGITYQGTTRSPDQYIVKLRQKIEKDPAKPKYLLTMHSIGYKFCSGK